MGALIIESDAGSINEVLNGVRHQDLPRGRLSSDSCRDMDCDPTDVVTAPHTLTGVQPATNVNTQLLYALGNRRGAQNGPSGAIECRQYAVAGVFDESPLERSDLGTRYLVVACQQLAPPLITKLGGASGWNRRCR